MPRYKRRRASPGERTDFKHVRLHRWLMQSAAWIHLSLAGRCALIELYALYNGENNGYVFLSVRELGRRLGCAPNTALKALTDLCEKKFIRPAQKGHFDLKTRHATSWVLAEFDYANQPCTRDFMRWQAPPKTQKPVSTVETDGSKICDRGPAEHAQNSPDSVKICDRRADFGAATVAKSETQIVYQGGDER